MNTSFFDKLVIVARILVQKEATGVVISKGEIRRVLSHYHLPDHHTVIAIVKDLKDSMHLRKTGDRRYVLEA